MRPRNTETETQSFPTSRTNFATGFAQGAATGAQLIYSGETSHNFCPGQEQGPRRRGGRSVVGGGRERPPCTCAPRTDTIRYSVTSHKSSLLYISISGIYFIKYLNTKNYTKNV